MNNTLKGLCICTLLASGMTLQAQVTGQTYFKVGAGASLVNDIDVSNASELVGIGGVDAEIQLDPGVRADLTFGYMFSEELALELSPGFIYNSVDKIAARGPGGSGSVGFDADYYQVPVLANVVYHFPLESSFKPYLGAGAGGIWSIFDVGNASEDDVTFAFQGIAGVDYELNENVRLGLAYKFLGALEPDFNGLELDNVYTHSLTAVVTFKF